MRTSYENWSRENWIATIVMTAAFCLPTVSCGVALSTQSRQLNSLRATILEKCNAEAAARTGEAQPAAVPRELPGLRPELRRSAAAREAFAVCMDDRRGVNFVPVAFNAERAAPPPASARRTN